MAMTTLSFSRHLGWRRQWVCQRKRQLHASIPRYDSERLKILFMGRDEFSCLVLRELHAASDIWDELVVVTNQDQRIGRRGSQLSISPLKVLAQDLDRVRLEYIPHTKPEFRKWELPQPFSSYMYSSHLGPEAPQESTPPPPPSQHVLVTASFGRILTRKHLSHFPPSRRLNVHPSLLPQYRGPAPIQHSLLNGDTETGVCVIEMLDAVSKKTKALAPAQEPATADDKEAKRSGIDAGYIWASARLPQPATANFGTMRDILAIEGGKLLVQVLRKMKNGVALAPVPQITSGLQIGLRPAPMIGLEDALADPISMTSVELYRKSQAIAHQRPIYTFRTESNLHQKPVQLHDITLLQSLLPSTDRLLPKAPGSAICVPSSSLLDYTASTKDPSKRLLIRCKDSGVVSVLKLKPEGKPILTATDYWNGIKVKATDGSIKFGPAMDQSPISTT